MQDLSGCSHSPMPAADRDGHGDAAVDAPAAAINAVNAPGGAAAGAAADDDAEPESQRYTPHTRAFAFLMAVSQMTREEVTALYLSGGRQFPPPQRMGEIMQEMPLNLRDVPMPQAADGDSLPAFQPTTKALALSAGSPANVISKAHRNASCLAKRAVANFVETTSTNAKSSLKKGYKLIVHQDALDVMLTILRGGVGRAGVNKWRATSQVDVYVKRGRKQKREVEPFEQVAAAEIEGPPTQHEYERSCVQYMVRIFICLAEASKLSARFAAAYASLGVDERAAEDMLRKRDPTYWKPVQCVRKQRDEADAMDCAGQIIGERPRKFHKFLLDSAALDWMGLHRPACPRWGIDMIPHTVFGDAGTIDVSEMLKRLHGISFRGRPNPPLVRFQGLQACV